MIIHGHRGCRGLMPENTVAGFLHAIDIGVGALELDVVINGDGDLLVSHEPWISPRICLDPDGNELHKDATERINLFKMNQRNIEQYDCGLKPHPWFPEQRKLAATKPLLKNVIDEVEEYVSKKGVAPILWNIEVKSKEKWYGEFQPLPDDFAQAVLKLIQAKQIFDRTVVQSFDTNFLRSLNQLEPSIQLAILVDNQDGLKLNLERLGFTLHYYSPKHELVDADLVQEIVQHDMKWLVWTVNEMEDIQRISALKPDGIITDFPDRLQKI